MTQELIIVPANLASIFNACRKWCTEQPCKILLRPYNFLAASLAEMFGEQKNPPTLYILRKEREISSSDSVTLVDDAVGMDLVVVCSQDENTTDSILMDQVDVESTSVIAPITSGYYKHRPLFLITIPKSGTHLLYRLVEVFGYDAGVVCPENPIPWTWYCVEYSNSHTSATDFFIDSVRRQPFGNRDHPFMRSPALFMYRNPLDILVSEANYYHKDGNTAFAGYLRNRSYHNRLLTLIDDPWLLGTLRTRIGKFIPWLEFSNVIPVSYEELVGTSGGGNRTNQERLIWSVQLKLQIPGKPSVIASQLYRKDSPTFHRGVIGAFRKEIPEDVLSRFLELPQDFMQIFGYDFIAPTHPPTFSKRIEEFRKRPLLVSAVDFQETPITVTSNLAGYNIVKYRKRFHILPQNAGTVDLTSTNLNIFCSKKTQAEAANEVFRGRRTKKAFYYLRRILNRNKREKYLRDK